MKWKDGHPVSEKFDDIYFSTEDGKEETYYVFIEGNDLKNRWQDNSDDFTIIETGFGTGLNFFCAYELWKSLCPNRMLNYISIEKYPLSSEDIVGAISKYPQFSKQLDAFLKQYPCQDIKLENCSIKILFEDIKTALPKINISADAWFLDGFAPSKNPDMWCEELYKTMSARTKPDGTFATFTSAGIVRRGLQENNFTVIKQRGFGKKREMLRGKIL
ncbi:MAG: tRNA (5-methylaminomethyl-2-thiouridine)(34)-methyltransferase MnmD [Rickettsiales bacterium]|nr:tRNA (5-methylaminomethyl-2-thiouridine)(34)-methyltransferase MnmD [Pseudomonadota bacterium]MDA0966916.1 tRNA (5-methylaminomethyl-2-thiouridine)(34)-methyltransferase MnmD [Pseudomonadota bacterium]MDG4544469.1 tRNA (5-methylaminomethyl-2-thiouridine)(34)-methyltransferase MnmD [Rickettsiales bacterium]MDG4546620.1 tRNA (5-methylaminomethyl-2-thiouridine)(34)-methyltransferase MnmD [Rickettsiales bacterium]MDG4548745.1 tRNA (5-methylaminomethyl-2-thiouridine)(34)-methyltransferase MnmD [R